METASTSGYAQSGERLQMALRVPQNPPASRKKQYWFEPGQTLEIEVAGLGAITVTGEFMDHMPSIPVGDEVLDPKPDELRVVSPLLVRDNKVVLDFAGMTLIADTRGGVQMYKSGLGRYLLSLSPLKGAAEGKVEQSRIFFEMDGHAYQLLTGAPVARSKGVWVLYQPQYKPSSESPGQADDSDFGGSVELEKLGDLVVRN